MCWFSVNNKPYTNPITQITEAYIIALETEKNPSLFWDLLFEFIGSELGKWVKAGIAISIMHRPKRQGAKNEQAVVQKRLLLLRSTL